MLIVDVRNKRRNMKMEKSNNKKTIHMMVDGNVGTVHHSESHVRIVQSQEEEKKDILMPKPNHLIIPGVPDLSFSVCEAVVYASWL